MRRSVFAESSLVLSLMEEAVLLYLNKLKSSGERRTRKRLTTGPALIPFIGTDAKDG